MCIRDSVYVAEFDLAKILASSRILFDVEAIPTYPPVLEDLAVVVDEEVAAAEVEVVLWLSLIHI